jgi:hypothetical protein
MEKKGNQRQSIFSKIQLWPAAPLFFGVGQILIDQLANVDKKKSMQQNKNKNVLKTKNDNIKISTKKENIKYESYLDGSKSETEIILCPISQEIMQDPVITQQGITYDRKYI